jgi:hypothetical protein
MLCGTGSMKMRRAASRMQQLLSLATRSARMEACSPQEDMCRYLVRFWYGQSAAGKTMAGCGC